MRKLFRERALRQNQAHPSPLRYGGIYPSRKGRYSISICTGSGGGALGSGSTQSLRCSRICRCGTGHRTVSLSHSENATARFVWQEVLVAAVGAPDASEPLAEVAARKRVPDHLGDHGPEVAVGDGVFLGLYPLELIVMPADDPVEGCFPGPSRPIDTFRALRHEEQVKQRWCREKKIATASGG